MRDYWLTQDLLRAAGFGYLAMAAAALALAAWWPKGWKLKLAAVIVVTALASILPIQSVKELARERIKQEAVQARYAEAKALFDERCKTAGEKINRTVENVEGVVWMKWRQKRRHDAKQFEPDDLYGGDCSLEGCMLRLLQVSEGAIQHPEAAKLHAMGYRFVETIDPRDGIRYRYTGVLKSLSESTKEEFTRHVENTGFGAEPNGSFFALRREPIVSFSARYGINWDDISTQEDREHWIAGGSIRAIDLQTNEVVAERVGYLIDTGQGSTAGFRDPWGWASSYGPRCPRVDIRTWEFATTVLQPK